MKRMSMLIFVVLFVNAGSSAADAIDVTVHLLTETGVGELIGTIRAEDTQYGAVVTPNLSGLTAGLHGFHVHQNPDCGLAEKDGNMVPGLAAGGHYDPASIGQHLGPYADGHLGDLPGLYVKADGTATHPVLAPRIKVSGLAGRSLMIHAGGDNYSDDPNKLGGGGARMACGVIE